MRTSRWLLIVAAVSTAALAGVLVQKLPGWWTERKALAAYRDAERLRAAAHFREAEVRAKDALALYEKRWGPSHLDLADAWNLLGSVSFSQQKVGQAEDAYQRAIHLNRELIRRPNAKLAGFLSNLGNLRLLQGQLHKSLELHKESLQIREATLGPQHKEIAASLNHIAISYAVLGQYADAEELASRGLKMMKALHLEQDDITGDLLNTLGAVYKEQGSYSRAAENYRSAVEVWKVTHGKNHPQVSHGYSNLGSMELEQGNFAAAQADLREAYRLRVAAFGEDSPDVAFILINIASCDIAQGELARGLAEMERARKVFGKSYGPGHPYTIACEIGMAGVYLQQGALDRAQNLLQTARSGLEQLGMGDRHPFSTQILGGMARVLAAGGHFDDAVEKWRQEFLLSEQRLQAEAVLLTEERRAALFNSLRGEEEYIYSTMIHQPEQLALRRLATEVALLRKGRSLDVSASLSRISQSTTSVEDRKKWQNLHVLQAQYAELAVSGAPGATDQQIRPMLVELNGEIEELHRGISQRIAKDQSPVSSSDLKNITASVQSALPADTALIEYIKFRQRGLLRADGDPLGKWRYLALVLTRDSSEPAMVDLGEATDIDRAANRLLAAVSNPEGRDEGASASLYTYIFKPLEPLLRGKPNLFLSPDGQLNLIPFAALQDSAGVLLDRFRISYVTSGRDLLPRRGIREPSRSVVVVANPAFDKSPARALLAAASQAQRSLVFSNPAPLPGTAQEAEVIKKIFPEATLLFGQEASESAVLRLDAPGILHIATHGFFWDDSDIETTRAGSRPVSVAKPPPPADPLLRSMLALAGVSLGSKEPQARDPDDGFLTAMELASMNLWRTQMVVLSACDTGRGEVMVGQGVYGLRRAVMAAGAETLVTSLWKLDDLVTKDLIGTFYQQLVHGVGRADAMRQAAREIRNNRKYQHPYYWASFIVLGNIDPLRWNQ